MAKKENDKRKEVLKLLRAQKIRDVKEIESYKLSVCHIALTWLTPAAYMTNSGDVHTWTHSRT